MEEICTRSLLEKRWVLRSCDESLALTFMQKLAVSPMLARLLSMRGHTLSSAPLFLDPSLRQHLPEPFILKDMERAVERLTQAIISHEKILVWGDYDVDGATSSALLSRFFKSLNTPVAIYIPDRVKEGYGPNINGIQKFQSQGYRIMITVDCGTTSFEALETAQDMDVIVLDHHASEAKLPHTYALVNPNRLDERPEITEALGSLAAVGIVFLFVVALNRTLRERGFYQTHTEPNLFSLLDLVALGTVCDVMPLTGLNRTFVTQGLKVMAKRSNIGLKALADIAGIDEPPTPYHLGFILGPRVNAGGRVGESFLGARLLSTENPEEASTIAQQLDHYNRERRTLEEEALNQALLQVDPQSSALIVDRKGWHEGVIGIIAGRLKEQFHKPTAVITWNAEGIGKGSARSIPGFDFGRFIHKAHHLGYVLGGGGHAMAAGFSLRKDQLSSFKNFLAAELNQRTAEIDLTPLAMSDGYLDFYSLTPAFIEELEKFAPFGMGNPMPKFIFSGVTVKFYQLIQDQHIRCHFSHGSEVTIEGIGFRLKGTPLGDVLMNQSRPPLDLLASPKHETWRGKTKIKLVIEDATYASMEMKKAASAY